VDNVIGLAPPQGNVNVPNWQSEQDVDEGSIDDQGNVILSSAQDLGLKVNAVFVDNGAGDMGDVISIVPPRGTKVPRGSIVTVTIQRNPGRHDA